MKTAVYVMTHRKCALPDIPGYIRMQVGSALHDDLGYLRDDQGEDHISDLNLYYAELTGVYSLWRNLPDVDNIGICHYRRYFINEQKQIMTMPEFEELLKDADIVAAVADAEQSFWDLYAKAHSIEDLEAVKEAIQRIYPEDYLAFMEVMKEKRCTYGNLCVMRKQLFSEYCEWLFTIFAEAGESIDIDKYEDDHQKKVYGFLGEPMLWVYIRARGLRMRECKAAFFCEKAETTELKNALRYLTQEGRFEDALSLYEDVLRQRPDLAYREADLSGELADMIDVLKKLRAEQMEGKSALYDVSHNLDELIKRDQKFCVLVKGVLPVLDYLAEEYAEAFRQLGYETRFLDYQDFENSAKRILSLVNRRIEFVMAFNNVGFVLSKQDGSNYWEEKGIPAYDLLVDHPMYYADTLDEAPTNGIVICADAAQPDYISRFYPAVKKSLFLPTAGSYRMSFEKQLSFSERPIDFLMIGNYKHCEIPEDEYATQLYEMMKENPEIEMEKLAERIFRNRDPEGEDASLKMFIEKYRFVTVELTARYREELLSLLMETGYSIEAYGNGWEKSSCYGKAAFTVHNPVPAEEGIRLMGQAKFVLNNMAWFKDGGSERVYNAMLQGALVISDRSGYLERDYDEESILWYDLKDMQSVLPDVRGLLESDGTQADEMRKKAFDITYLQNRWLHRADTLLKYHENW